MNKMNKKGFTIVELVIVIAVIAILAGVLIPTFGGIIDKANESKALQEVKNAYTATLADDMATPGTSDDVVYDKDVTVVYGEGEDAITFTISKTGVITKVASGTATHTLTGGKLVAVANS